MFDTRSSRPGTLPPRRPPGRRVTCAVLATCALLVACGPGRSLPAGAVPGQPCSLVDASLHPVHAEQVLEVAAVEAAMAAVDAAGEAHFSLHLRAPEGAERREPELAPVTMGEPVLVLGGTLDGATTDALARALSEARGRRVENELPGTLRVTLRPGPGSPGEPRIQVEPAERCSPALVDRRRLALALEEVTRASGRPGVETTADLLVDATGQVKAVRFDEAGEGFHGRVLLEQALLGARFHPGVRDGLRVSTWVSLPVTLVGREE